MDGTGAMFILEGEFVEQRSEEESEATARPSERADVAWMIEILGDNEKELVREREDLDGGGGGGSGYGGSHNAGIYS